MIPIIAGNWKMYKTAAQAVEFIKEIKELVRGISVKLIICPPFTALSDSKKALINSGIKLGAQNLYFKEEGAFTGEISPVMLKEFCDYVIVGHSERRAFFNETDDTVNKKVKTAIQYGLIPIICVGENLEQREQNKTMEIIEKQLRIDLKSIIGDFIIAYEPLWAIGTGKTASPQQAEEVHSFIRKLLKEICDKKADETNILYGGSVNPTNIRGLMEQENIDGALVGGASLDAQTFYKVIINSQSV